MFETIDTLRLAQSMASHAGQRQALSAQNIAHADTPGYRPVDLAPFASLVQDPAPLTRTRTGHLGDGSAPTWAPMIDADATPDPNGNAVSLEREMLRSAEIRAQHDLALSIYRSTLGVLRSSLGRGR